MKLPFNLFSSTQPEPQGPDVAQNEPIVLAGQEDNSSSLPVQTISYFFCKIGELSSLYAQLFANELKVPIGTVRKDLERMLKNVRADISCCIEYPYVDEYYRDTYYIYYSRKHHDYNRYCFRVSFFNEQVNNDNYLTLPETEMQYYGYMVLRPTVRCIIGYTFISPLLFSDNGYSICLCERLTSVMGRRQQITAFPFCGQDGEITLCAETSIVMTFDYFSRRYNRYNRVLPSSFFGQVYDNLPDRAQPSRGLDVEMVTSIFCSLGMNIRRFELTDKEADVDGYSIFLRDKFKQLLHIYIESGFPLYAVTSTHAFLIIGRENKLFCRGSRLVTINDREYPYKLLSLEQENDIRAFLVPLPSNVLLDADKIDVAAIYDQFSQECNNMRILEQGRDYLHRVFLTTSRSFKQFVVKSNICETSKRTIVGVAMPKFIWVCESILASALRDDISSIEVSSILVLDATNYPEGSTHLLLIKSSQYVIIPDEGNIGKTEKVWNITEVDETMPLFNANLKGNHTQWKG